MSLLITGAAGFIGFALAKASLELGNTIYLVDNYARGRRDDYFDSLCSNSKVVLIEGDLLDPDFCKSLPYNDIDFIYHFAAINGTQNFYDKPYEVIKANFSTLTNILDSIPADKNIKFLYSSSSETYAGSVELGIAPIPTPENIPLTVADPTNLRWSYGASKLLAEVALNSFSKHNSITSYIVRFHNIYGPRMGNKHVVPNFIDKIHSLVEEDASTTTLMGADQTRSFCYIDDAVRALLMFYQDSIPTGIYNIGDPREEISILELFRKCSHIILGNNYINIEPIPAPIGSVSRRVPDISKISSYGYFPSTSLEEGLKKTISWYTSQTAS